MQLILMREEPENSGTYVDVEGEIADTPEAAVKLAAEKSAEGGRYAIRVYDSIRSDANREQDVAETQRTAHPPAPAQQPAPTPSAAQTKV